MHIYLFENVSKVSGMYHSEGAVMVVARNAEAVKALIAETPYVELTQDNWDCVRIFSTSSMELPEVFIFADSGCC